MCGHKRVDNVIEDFCDSKHCSTHELWGSNDHALQILLYFNEVELCNPLGSSRKIHKLGTIKLYYMYYFIKKYIGCFYFTLGNLSPKYRSTLKLLALIKNVHIKKYGIESVLECITCDIKKLEKVNDSKVYKSNID